MGKTAKAATAERIEEMVRIIVDRFDPERIILFGSRSRGTAGPDSDIDLLVVMRVDGSKREKQLEIRRSLHDIRGPKDVIVTTPEEYEWRREIPGTLERPAAMEGEVLYARS
jgi:predicted nucleotidyltransferase